MIMTERLIDYENPWLFEGSPFLSEDIDDLYGFVYCITNTVNSKRYIGRKYFWSFEKLEVKVGELEVKATGKNITDLLMRYASMSRSSGNNAFKGLY